MSGALSPGYLPLAVLDKAAHLSVPWFSLPERLKSVVAFSVSHLKHLTLGFPPV